jgi:hypothetical protein
VPCTPSARFNKQEVHKTFNAQCSSVGCDYLLSWRRPLPQNIEEVRQEGAEVASGVSISQYRMDDHIAIGLPPLLSLKPNPTQRNLGLVL